MAKMTRVKSMTCKHCGDTYAVQVPYKDFTIVGGYVCWSCLDRDKFPKDDEVEVADSLED